MRAIKFAVGALFGLALMPAFASIKTMTCISENNAFVSCHLPNADQRDIRIKSVRAGDCTHSNSWGVDSDAIWVDKGCGAVFEYTSISQASSNNSDNYDNGPSIIIAPGFIEPFFGPDYYYGAGFYQYNGWNNHHYHHGHYEDGGHHGHHHH